VDHLRNAFQKSQNAKYRELLEQYLLALVRTQERLDRDAEILATCPEAEDLLQQHLEQEPDNLQCRSNLGAVWGTHGLALMKRDRHQEALRELRKAVKHQRAAFDKHPQAVYRDLLEMHYLALTGVLLELDRLPEAADLLRERQKLHPRDPNRL